MKVLQSIWSLASENGGPTRSTIGLSKALACEGVEVMLVSHVPGKVSAGGQEDLKACGVRFCEGRGNGLFTALKDSRRILDEFKPDIVHLQGLWKMSTHAMNVMAAKRGIPIVISPRGMLDPWALSVKKWKKRLGMLMYQHHALKRAKAIHVTSELEAKHVRDFGLRQPIIIAANGVTIPPDTGRVIGKASIGEGHTAVFISRLHPGKGLLLLVDAWAKVKPDGWKMVVAGPDRYGHKVEVVARLHSLGVEHDWDFVGELNDDEKWRALSRADLFIHPSASENFGISIAEALAAGVPVITTKGCPWAEIQNRCGWWIDRNVDSLVAAMREAMAFTDEQRQAMGEKGRQLIREKYSWPAIARQVIKGYEGIVSGKCGVVSG